MRPVVGGIRLYNTGYESTQSFFGGLASYTTTSTFSYLQIYSFYPKVISTRIAVGAGLGLGIPIRGTIGCEGTGCVGEDITLETENIGKEVNLLFNTSFAVNTRYAIRLYYQHGLTEIGEYFPMIEDDPATPLGIADVNGQFPGDESQAGMKGFTTKLMGVALLLRF